MFETLTERLSRSLSVLSGRARLTEDNIQSTLREIRMALLEADVALPVVTRFVDQVRARAIGTEVTASLSPGQVFIGIVNEELIRVMGSESGALELAVTPPAVILMAGLQGSGKTTSSAKLARRLRLQDKKSVMVASADVYRPAAIEQLERLAAEAEVRFFPSSATQSPEQIARDALATARRQFVEVLIVDTAGRLHVDEEMMREIRALHEILEPAETLFVVDAMTGQDAAISARAFGDAVPLTGVIMTKVDGDARGGAALSVKEITGKPIKFLATGEKIDALDTFHPDRIASRILGMGDVLSLIEEVEQKVDREKAERVAKKLQRGRKFDLEDFRDQIQQMNNLGGVASLIDKMPGVGAMAQASRRGVDERIFVQMEAIINSMTPAERRYPDKLNGSRKRRIALGSGTQIQDINRLLKQHKQMQKMMQKLTRKGGMASMMRGMNANLSRGGPPPRH